MRLDKLNIIDFKNLSDFYIDFAEQSLTTVLIGQNGTGKSNLLEALVIIFGNLYLREPPEFAYKIKYFIHDYRISIDADPRREKGHSQISIDGKKLRSTRFSKKQILEYLPNNVFGYYSGPTNRLESHFDKHQDRFYRALLNGDDNVLRPMFYARLIHSQFVLLSFFAEPDDKSQQVLREHLGIVGLDSILFVMNEPSWDSKDGDPRFWYARGEVAGFLSKLFELSFAPMRLSQTVPVSFRKNETREFLYLYLKDVNCLSELSSAYTSQRDFFKALESTYISELISEVRIRVKIKNIDGSLTFRELSEGEQQLLTVLGLLKFTKNNASLFLLDEPDTHLNPVWSLKYLQLLKDVVGDEDSDEIFEKSHIIMTTHDPVMIAGLEREQVQILKRNDDTRKIIAEHPEQDPKGMGIAAILTSELFGLRSALDLETMSKLDEKRRLASLKTLTVEQKKRLGELNDDLENLGFSRTKRDPLYEQFVKAMTKRKAYQNLTNRPTLTENERKRQRKLAQEVLDEILNSGGG